MTAGAVSPMLVALVTGGALASCATIEPLPREVPETSPGDEIVVCGERFATGAPVVLWFDEPGYSAYATVPRFETDGPAGLRYQPGRTIQDAAVGRHVRRSGWTLDTLSDVVDLFVLHCDVCGTSRTCFKVLQDRRQLSVHFLLDVDGTIYQTLDLQEQAWHARQANPRSIGIEIAHIGAYPVAPDGTRGERPLDEWYARDAEGTRITIPARFGDGGVRTPNFVGRPARDARVVGEIGGERYEQFDFTREQYESLTRLAATLTRIFPRLAADAPRDATGAVRTDVLSDAELERFHGILGHYHVSASKHDPGPAFDWERFLAGVRRLEPGPSPRIRVRAAAARARSIRPR